MSENSLMKLEITRIGLTLTSPFLNGRNNKAPSQAIRLLYVKKIPVKFAVDFDSPNRLFVPLSIDFLAVFEYQIEDHTVYSEASFYSCSCHGIRPDSLCPYVLKHNAVALTDAFAYFVNTSLSLPSNPDC